MCLLSSREFDEEILSGEFFRLAEFEVLSFGNLGNLLSVFRSTCHTSSTFKMIFSLGISMLVIVQLYGLAKTMVINLFYVRSN